MSVLRDIGYDLDLFIDDLLGEERVHELAGEFLGTPYEASNPLFDVIDEITHNEPLFGAWLWFDYLLDGKSMIEQFLDSQPKLGHVELTELNRMVRTMYFGLFQIGSVKPGNIELSDLSRGTTYHIREYSLASQVKTGQLLLARICQQADHWEIIMPDGSMMPITIDSPELLKALIAELPDRITICDTPGYGQLRTILGIGSSDSQEYPERLSQKDASVALEKEMEKAGLTRYISFETITAMLKREYKSKELPLSPPLGTRVLFGLVNDDTVDPSGILNASSAYWNSLGPTRKLKKMEKRGKKYQPDLHLDTFNAGAWGDYAEKAHGFLLSNKLEDSIRTYNELFEMLLDQKMVTPSVYRLVTNTAVAHLAHGDYLIGERLVDEALRLCPTYDFALKQQDLIDDSQYVKLALSRAASNPQLTAFAKIPDKVTRQGLSDAELVHRFKKLGVVVDPGLFIELARSFHDQTKLIESLDVADKDFDHVDALVSEARDRWAPEVIWVDTIHDLTFRLEDAVYPSSFLGLPQERTSVKKVAQDLASAVELADKSVIRSWMYDTSEYMDDRQNIIFYSEDMLGKPTHYGALLELCKVVHGRTKDPIFAVPEVLKEIRSRLDDDEKSQSLIKKQAAALPQDHNSMQIIGDALSETHKKLAVLAFELGFSALKNRVKKGLWDIRPYDSQPISEHLDYLVDSLIDLYEVPDDAKKLSALDVEYDELVKNKRIFEDPSKPKGKSSDQDLGLGIFANDPVLAYLEWFNTLGVNLTEGDGKETKLTPNVLNKVGRNDPCPCGALKNDGTAVKFKKCHGTVD